MRGHFQIDLPEALLAQDIGHRLPFPAPLQVAGVGLGSFAADDALWPCVQITARLAKRRRQQQLGIQALGRRIG